MKTPPVDEDIYTAEKHTNVYAAIAYVMERVSYVQKQRSGGLRYSYAGEEGLIDALREEVINAGLVLTVDDVTCSERNEYKTSKGSVMQSTVLRLKGRWTHWPTSTFAEVCAMGEGADVGDKGVPKAMTGAYKYILRETFLLKTGDDPDKDAAVPRNTNASNPPEQHSTRPSQRQAAPPSGGKCGRGGETQACPKCGAQGVTPRNFDPKTNRPDAECPQGCAGNPKQGGGNWPMGWWTVPKGSKAPQQAAFDAQAPQGFHPSQEDDIPFGKDDDPTANW